MIRDRREFLRAAGLCGLGATLWLAGCGGNTEQSARKTGQAAASAAGENPCQDLSDLSDAQIKLRQTFAYVDRSEDPDTACRHCNYFKEPAPGGACGGCMLMEGPQFIRWHSN